MDIPSPPRTLNLLDTTGHALFSQETNFRSTCRQSCFLLVWQGIIKEPIYSQALCSAMVISSSFCRAIFSTPFLLRSSYLTNLNGHISEVFLATIQKWFPIAGARNWVARDESVPRPEITIAFLLSLPLTLCTSVFRNWTYAGDNKSFAICF